MLIFFNNRILINLILKINYNDVFKISEFLKVSAQITTCKEQLWHLKAFNRDNNLNAKQTQ
jgi:hypothetical protein